MASNCVDLISIVVKEFKIAKYELCIDRTVKLHVLRTSYQNNKRSTLYFCIFVFLYFWLMKKEAV